MYKKAFFPEKVLISTGELFRYIHGANMVFLELSEYFLSKGCEVVIYTNLALPPMLEEARALKRADRLEIIDDPEKLTCVDFDLIFMHDNTLPDNIVSELGRGLRTRIVPLHLSPFVHIEMPLFVSAENSIADIIACVSKETSAEMIRRGLSSRKIWIMENFVPLSMIPSHSSAGIKKLSSVAIVTNHLSNELVGAIKILNKEGITVDHFGEGGNKLSKMTSNILESYDAIVSIGKTVQYGLTLGVPVYLYDHFGGPGWVNSSNFEQQLDFNFSGRATREQKTSTDIARELVEGYLSARRYALANFSSHQNRFSIETKMNNLMKQLPLQARLKKLTFADELSWNNFNQMYRGMYRGYEYFKDQTLKHEQKT